MARSLSEHGFRFDGLCHFLLFAVLISFLSIEKKKNSTFFVLHSIRLRGKQKALSQLLLLLLTFCVDIRWEKHIKRSHANSTTNRSVSISFHFDFYCMLRSNRRRSKKERNDRSRKCVPLYRKPHNPILTLLIDDISGFQIMLEAIFINYFRLITHTDRSHYCL